jgi:hypothetical protein
MNNMDWEVDWDQGLTPGTSMTSSYVKQEISVSALLQAVRTSIDGAGTDGVSTRGGEGGGVQQPVFRLEKMDLFDRFVYWHLKSSFPSNFTHHRGSASLVDKLS